LILFLLPFISLVLPNGNTPKNQARLDTIMARVDRLAAACHEQKLKDLLVYTSQRYRTLGPFGVRIQSLRLFNAAGVNFPWVPGLIIDSEFWQYPDSVVLVIIVHEALHDYYPWGGHYNFWGTVPCSDYKGTTELERLMWSTP